MDYLKVEGQSAIVTGAAQGIGEGIAKTFAEYGIRVLVCDIQEDKGIRVVKDICKAGGIAEFCYCDVTNTEDVKNAINMAIDKFGSLEIIINNAGIGSNCSPVEEITDEVWNRMMDVDIKSAFNFTRAAMPYMKEKRYGKIVNISSGGGISGMLHLSHYATAKAALFGFTKSIAREGAPFGINVNCIATPTTLTPATTAYDYDSDWEEEIKLIPKGRIATPRDIADMALYLVSASAEYVTGQVVAPNGGKR